MYKQISDKKSAMKGINGYDADCIEEKVRKIMNSKEPITDGAPLIYTERKEGVKPSYNIRTDRWEHAVEAMDKVTKAKIAARENRGKVVEMNPDKSNTPNDAGGEPTQATT